MKGDFSRLTFDATRHYAGVRLQQGRMILDADWNEQADISDHQRITQLLDLVGESGAPSETPHGFELKVSTSQTQPEFTFQAGRLYAGGYLCELEHDLVLSEASLHDTATEIWRRFPQEVPEGSGKSPFSGPGSWLFYLDVWTRLVTYAENERLVEPALGGLDTSLRLETVWQIRWMKDPGEGARSSAMGLDRRTGIRLNTRLSGGSLDNQLYRVEAHRGGTLDQADFKWARDNASVVAPIDAIDGDGTLITCGPTPWDIPDRFSPGDWVEVVNDRLELTGQPGPLGRVTRVLGFQLVVEWQPDDSAANLTGALRLRRWDGYFTASAGSVELERGIAVQVELESGAELRTGDFWMIASRAGANSLEPPFHTGEALAPMGIFRRRVALATFRRDNQSSSWGDLRTVFAPLTRPLDVHDLGLKGLTLQDPNDENVDLHLSNIDGVLAVRRDLENAAHVDIDGNLAVGGLVSKGSCTIQGLFDAMGVTSPSVAINVSNASVPLSVGGKESDIRAEADQIHLQHRKGNANGWRLGIAPVQNQSGSFYLASLNGTTRVKALTVTGAGDVEVRGKTTLDSLTVMKGAAAATLALNGAPLGSNALAVSGTASVSGALAIVGATPGNDALAVKGTARFDLGVSTGTAEKAADLTVPASVTIYGRTTIKNAAATDSTADVHMTNQNGVVYFWRETDAQHSNPPLRANLSVDGDLAVGHFGNDDASGARLRVSGNAYVSGGLTVDSEAVLSSLTVTTSAKALYLAVGAVGGTSTNTLVVNGGTSFFGDVEIGNTSTARNLTVSSKITCTRLYETSSRTVSVPGAVAILESDVSINRISRTGIGAEIELKKWDEASGSSYPYVNISFPIPVRCPCAISGIYIGFNIDKSGSNSLYIKSISIYDYGQKMTIPSTFKTEGTSGSNSISVQLTSAIRLVGGLVLTVTVENKDIDARKITFKDVRSIVVDTLT